MYDIPISTKDGKAETTIVGISKHFPNAASQFYSYVNLRFSSADLYDRASAVVEAWDSIEYSSFKWRTRRFVVFVAIADA